MYRLFGTSSRSIAAAALTAAFFTPAYADHGSANASYGTPVHVSQADREIRITSGTRWANVMRNETIRFVIATPDQGEKSFTWKFDTLGLPAFDLKQVAPKGVLGDQRITVYVSPNTWDLCGDVELAAHRLLHT